MLFMGDSITDNWGRQYGKFFPGKPYINRGISGQTTPQMLIRFRPDVIALRPAVVVILAGTNDIAGNTGRTTLEAIEDNLTSMVELARANGFRVVLASLLPACDYIKPQTPATISTPAIAHPAFACVLLIFPPPIKPIFMFYFGGGAVDDSTGFPSAVFGSINSMRCHPGQRGSPGVFR